MSGSLKVGGSELINDNGGSGALQWGSGLPSGSIVQVQSTQYGTASGESGSMSTINPNLDYVLQSSGAVSGGSQSGILDVNITPRITGSKIWLQAHWIGEMDQDITYNTVFFFWRNTTKLASADHSTANTTGVSVATITYHGNAISTPEQLMMQYFDIHGISAGTQITYKVGFRSRDTNLNVLTTNRTINNAEENGVSSICAIELAP